MSIDISLPALWQCFLAFQKGKRRTQEFEEFCYHLERNLRDLHAELVSGTYRHGPYRSFTVSDSKRRDIAVASLRDRLVHRLLYDYLEQIYDPIFIHDAWSCRKGKGLHRAVDRAQLFLRQYEQGWFWRADIRKFFDSVDHVTLFGLLERRVGDPIALDLLTKVIASYESDASARARARARGEESPLEM